MTLRYPYDTSYDGPAFPVIDLSLSGRRQGTIVDLTGLLDSGADATMIPRQVLEAIDARRTDVAWARTVAGNRYRVNLHLVTMTVGSIRLPSLEVISNAQTDEIIIGRDVLNQLSVTLNGPALEVEIGE